LRNIRKENKPIIKVISKMNDYNDPDILGASEAVDAPVINKHTYHIFRREFQGTRFRKFGFWRGENKNKIK
jgi:hypothetical protein